VNLTKNSRRVQEQWTGPDLRFWTMRRMSLLLAGSACALLLAFAASACSRTTGEQAEDANAASPPFATDYTIKDLMLNVIDANADVVWLSVTTVASEKGLVETRPTTDEEWARVKAGAITLAEAANLLMIPGRRTARPGEKSETPGVELEPEEMDVLIAKDRNKFNEHAKALYNAAKIAAQAAEKKDADKIFEVGETIEHACETCHREYWYPNEVIPELPKQP
jgi:cytochrome c556